MVYPYAVFQRCNFIQDVLVNAKETADTSCALSYYIRIHVSDKIVSRG